MKIEHGLQLPIVHFQKLATILSILFMSIFLLSVWFYGRYGKVKSDLVLENFLY